MKENWIESFFIQPPDSSISISPYRVGDSSDSEQTNTPSGWRVHSRLNSSSKEWMPWPWMGARISLSLCDNESARRVLCFDGGHSRWDQVWAVMFIIHLIDEGSPTLPPHLLPIFVASPPQWVLGMVQEPKTRTFQDPLLNPGVVKRTVPSPSVV